MVSLFVVPKAAAQLVEPASGMALDRAGSPHRGDGRGPGVVDVQPSSLRIQRPPQPLLAPLCVTADVGRHVHLADDIAGADH